MTTASPEAPLRVTDEDWEHRYTTHSKDYDRAGKNECWRMWHPGVIRGPYCLEPLGHEGDHKGFGMRWSRTPHVSQKMAEEFLACYRRIPNAYQDITLRDDGTVTMTLRAFRSAVQFIGAMSLDD